MRTSSVSKTILGRPMHADRKYHGMQCIELNDTFRCASQYHPHWTLAMKMSQYNCVKLHYQGTTCGMQGGEPLICLPALRPMAGVVGHARTFLHYYFQACVCSSPGP